MYSVLRTYDYVNSPSDFQLLEQARDSKDEVWDLFDDL